MKLDILENDFTVCKVTDYTKVNLSADFCFTGKTDSENSLVCPTSAVPDNTIAREDSWKGFRIVGTLDFSLIGILSKISGILAEERIGIFAVSTFDTDYVFVKAENFARAVEALRKYGYEFE